MSGDGGLTAVGSLAAYLTGTEARLVRLRLAGGESLSAAMQSVESARRVRVRELFAAAGLGTLDVGRTVAVLEAVEGATSARVGIDPILTVPGSKRLAGRVSASTADLVRKARSSVVCSTFNFETSSRLWEALREVAQRPATSVRVYLDAGAGGATGADDGTKLRATARQLRPGVLLRTRADGPRLLRNHAKFVSIDRQLLIVSSANFSFSAEHLNLELGLILDDPRIAQLVERQWADLEPAHFTVVAAR